MTKIILPSLLTTVFSIAAFSQTIVRTATIDNYTVEVQIEKHQTGMVMASNVGLTAYGDPEIAGHGFYACEETLSIQGDMKMTYILKSSSGKEIGRQTVRPEMIASARATVDSADAICQPLFSPSVTANFFHPDQYINFKMPEGTLSVSANFSAYVERTKNFTVTVDEKSLNRIRYFMNNKGGMSAELIDPSASPVESGDPYCSAHPYDCN